MPSKRPNDPSVHTLSGNDFEDEHEILTSRPQIEWEPPPPEDGEELKPAVIPVFEENRRRAEAIVEGYKRVVKLVDSLQTQIDKRVENAGGLEISLDPKKDVSTISAIKRRFPDVKDPTKIDYKTYKKALACSQPKLTVPALTMEDILKARQNPTTTNLGGLGEKPGALRQQNIGPQFGDPVDLDQFQKNAVLDLFKMMEGLIGDKAKEEVEEHERTVKHT